MQYQLQGEYLHWKCSLCVESYGTLYNVPLSFKILNLNSGGTYSMKWTLILCTIVLLLTMTSRSMVILKLSRKRQSYLFVVLSILGYFYNFYTSQTTVSNSCFYTIYLQYSHRYMYNYSI